MHRYVVLGAGRQGRAAAYDLIRGGGEVTMLDANPDSLLKARESLALPEERVKRVDFRKKDQVFPFLEAAEGTVLAADYSLNLAISEWAIEAGCHTVDYGGNHDVVHAQHELHDRALQAGVALVPDTGLTPGLAGILVAGGIAKLDRAKEARIRVGGLPQQPQPPLNYALIFSVRGLTNEYIEPSVVVENGQKSTRPSLTQLEHLRFGDREFEAFLTSGGVSTLPESFAGMLDHLDCKTIRYPGHAELIRFAFDIGFGSEEPLVIDGCSIDPRRIFEEMLVRSLPHDPPDETLLRVTVQGELKGRPHEILYEMIDLYDHRLGFTSMQKTTAWPGSIILSMLVEGDIRDRGVLYQERSVDAETVIQRLAERGVDIRVVSRDL